MNEVFLLATKPDDAVIGVFTTEAAAIAAAGDFQATIERWGTDDNTGVKEVIQVKPEVNHG